MGKIAGNGGLFWKYSHFSRKQSIFSMQISKTFGRQANTKENIFEMNSHRSTKIALLEEASFRLANYTQLTLGETEKTTFFFF